MNVRSIVALAIALVCLEGCAASVRPPYLLARGEAAVMVDHGLLVVAEGRLISRSPMFRELPDYVGCVEPARTYALDARRAGRRGRVLSILGATFGLGAAIGFGTLADEDHAYAYLGGALGSGVLGLGFALGGYRQRQRAFGRAVDAVNEYNDRVGSLGATCLDLRFEPPSGPASPEPYPATTIVPVVSDAGGGPTP